VGLRKMVRGLVSLFLLQNKEWMEFKGNGLSGQKVCGGIEKVTFEEGA